MKSPRSFTEFPSPLGLMTLSATDDGISGIHFPDQKHRPSDPQHWHRDDGPRFEAIRLWLAAYFASRPLPAAPAIDLATGTPFQQRVWRELLNIPFAETITYGECARRIGAPRAVRAVGAAIGRNPLSVLIPCHRVIGASGALTGYAGGLERKRRLLDHERSAALHRR